MADDLNVDIGISSNELESDLRRTFEALQAGLQTAQQMQSWFERTAKTARELPTVIRDLNDKLSAAKGTAGELGLSNQLKAAQEQQAQLNRELQREVQIQRELSLARGAGQRAAEGGTVADGRQIAQVRLTERAVADAITGINTTADQIAARLSIATGKAMERLIAGTAQQVEQSVQLAANRAMSTNAQLSVPGYLDASVVNARVAAETAVRRAGTGATLEERDAGRRMYGDAVEENRQRTLAANRIRRDAERENADRDRIYTQQQSKMMAEASYEDAERSRRMSRLQTQAEWDNRAFDRKVRINALRERSDANEENRLRTLEANRLRSQAEADNKQFDRNKAAAYRVSPEGRQEAAKNSFDARSAAFDLNGGADQFQFQTRLALNYAAFGGLALVFRSAASALVQFDDELKTFQAITGTADAEMDGFRKQLLETAAASKFSVGELTQVAVALGQTGLSAGEVGKALKPVVDLAAASGSTLQQSVEAITGVLGAYNLEAGRSGEVADVFVGALNKTKLTMDQLQLGIQYAANIARDSGISFSELTASIGAVAQAGVKSGSTIGTGIRQLITEFSAPTDKLRGVLKELGINLSDVDLRTQGFSGVLQNLSAKGFGTAEALRALDLRAASAFAALSGQSGKIDELQQEFLLSSAAAESAATANESFTATFQRLKNGLLGVVDGAMRPFLDVLTTVTGSTADFAGKLTALGPILPVVTAAISALATAAVGLKVLSLANGLIGNLFSGGALAALTGPVGLGAAALLTGGSLIYFLSKVKDDAGQAAQRLDELKKVQNELQGQQQTLTQQTSSLDTTITTLIDRREKLNQKDNEVGRQTAIIEAQKAFADLGLVVDANATSVDGLIQALQRLRGELGQEMPGLLAQQLAAVTEKISQLQKLEAANEAKSRTRQVVTSVTDFGDATTADVDPLERIRALGPEFNAAADFISGKSRFDPANVRKTSAPISADMGTTLLNLRRAESSVAIDGGLSETDRRTMLDQLRAQIDRVEEAIKLFGDKVNSVQAQQGAQIEQQRIARGLEAAKIQATPEFEALRNARDDIYGQQDAAITAAGRNAKGFPAYEAMQQAARSTDDVVKAKLAEIEKAKADAIAGGADKLAVDDAYKGVIEAFNTLLKGSTKEIRERFQSVSGDAKADLNQQIRNAQAQMELLQRQASTTANPDQVTELQGLATHYQEVINGAREKLFKIETGVNADQIIANSPELQDKQRELQEKGQADLNKLAVNYAELHRRVQTQLLSFQVDRATERRDLLQEQIKGLEKVRDDARSTPEQMRAAVQEINRLLGEVAKIGQGINKLNADKVDTKLPDAIGPTVKFDAGSTQQNIIDQLRAAGASEDRIRYALASGQIESGYSPDVVSGARRSSAGATGVFQFMPGTWQNLNGTRNVDTDIAAQVRALQQLTDRNADSFQQNMGRQATPEELYLMHQQGSAGALALLRAGSGSALDALTGVYGDAGKARQAITGNGGRADIAADDFVELIERKFRRAEAEVGNPFGTTGQAETDRQRKLTDDKTAAEAERLKAENERKAEANERARQLAELKRTDKALSETYDTQLEAVKRAQDPAAALSASRDAYATLRQLLDTAKKEDANKPGLDDDARTSQQEATRKRFAGLFQQQGLATAETIGKDSLKAYEDKLTQLRAEQKELERPENEGREGNTARLNVLRDEINELEKQKELQGTYEANQAKIVALEETLKQMKDAGLDVDRDGVEVQRRILELRERNKVLEPTMNLSRQQAGTQRSYGEAASGAMDSFLKSRGVLDFKGQVVDPVVQAQKTLTESLGTIGNAFDNLFTNLFNGSMKAGDALKSFATSILSGLMSQISKSLTNSIFQSLFTSGGAAGGGGILSGIGSLFGMYSGGPIRMAGGGAVPGFDAALTMRDSKPILAQPGEYLLRRSAVDAIGREQLDQVNALGGAMVNRAPKVDAGQRFGGASAAANVYVVDRDQVPPPSANDVVHMIGDNIQRGGAIRQLIKSVAARG